ncbi:DUF488 family protein [Citricoccus sp. NPDC079358]|uniref:DUF488 domain-containing protein n=1 Tax=Citricoccus sp. NPDC079358 TaxID=3154653 RepID=UPI00344E661F
MSTSRSKAGSKAGGQHGSQRGNTPPQIRLRRVYEAPDGGYRVLVDRIWPRGIAKADLELDEWCKSVAPSSLARKDFHHDPDRFADFTRRYEAELDASGRPGNHGEPDDGGEPAVDALLERWEDSCKDGTKDLVLLYAAKDPEVNHAVVLRRFLQSKSGGQGKSDGQDKGGGTHHQRHQRRQSHEKDPSS